MRRPPVPRRKVFDVYWRFASERQQVFERRIRGAERPWTTDRILNAFKFCNVFRAADRVSQYLIREVAYAEEAHSPADRLFQIVAFRLFSRIDTWQVVRESLGRAPVIGDLEGTTFQDVLEEAKARNGSLYTGAFILCATDAYGHRLKHRNHVELLRHMFVRTCMADRVLMADSLAAIVQTLRGYPLIGDFMSYQLAVDLNYSAYINFSENDCVVPGPGAMRGIRKTFLSLGDLTPSEVIMWMVERQADELVARGLPQVNLWGRSLHAIDCQGLFCEVDKYCREAIPTLRSSRSRIKARFRPSAERLPLFFPPKWGINDRIGLPVPRGGQREAVA